MGRALGVLLLLLGPHAACSLNDPVRLSLPTPTTTLIETPRNPTNDAGAAFVFECEPAPCGFQCSLDDGAFSVCESRFVPPGVEDGPHLFKVHGVNIDGTVDPSPASFEWIVDLEPPKTQIIQAPPATTPTSSVSFVFQCEDDRSSSCTYECRLDTSPFEPCGVRTDLWVTLGSHILSVRAIDAAGNADPNGAVHRWIVEKTWTDLDSARDHTCAVADDGTIWCWGSNVFGQIGDVNHDGPREPLKIPDGTNDLRFDPGFRRRPYPTRVGLRRDWAQVRPGTEYTCARHQDQTLWCWGRNEHGVIGPETGTVDNKPVQVDTRTWRALSRGFKSNCAIHTDGTMWCWGQNDQGQLGDGSRMNQAQPTQVSATTDWRQVASGGAHHCGLRSDGTIWCWGTNRFGETGQPASAEPIQPEPVGDPSVRWAQVRAGMWHTCGIDEQRALWCWGRNHSNQLGASTGSSTDRPTRIGSGSDWDEVAPGTFHTCGLRDGGLWCWGRNDRGQLGDGTFETRSSPVRVGASNGWVKVTAGDSHTCALDDLGAISCWGADQKDQLGSADRGDQVLPTPVEAVGGASNVTLAELHTCVRLDNSRVSCWGLNHHFQLGHTQSSTATVLPVEVSIAAGRGPSTIAAGLIHTCIIDGQRKLHCTGANYEGQLGVGDARQRGGFFPVAPSGQGTQSWDQVCAGRLHTCGIKSDGSLWCWGRTGYEPRRFDDPSNEPTTSRPMQHVGLWRSVSCGMHHNCAIRNDGALACWGLNEFGQVGTGRDEPDPKEVDPGPWASVAAGIEHSCAIDDAGAMWCWGRNQFSQLGLAEPQTTPTRVGDRNDWVAVATADATCAIDRQRSLWCWGRNDAHQIGDGSTVDRAVPVRVGEPGGWESIAAAQYHTCGIREDRLLCWGINPMGQLGSGQTPFRATPAKIVGRR